MVRARRAQIPEAVVQGTERSSLFWLLYESHARLSKQWRGRRISWPAVCAWAEQEGAFDRTGGVPKPNTAKMTWRRVCELKEREKEERASKRRLPVIPTPSRVAQPTAVRPSAQGPANAISALMDTIERRSGRTPGGGKA